MGKNPLKIVAEYLNKADEPYGLTVEKLYRRATVIEDKDNPDKIVFEVERHQPILGERYIPGTLMGNYVTTICQYIFDPKKEELIEETSRVIDVDIDIESIVERDVDGAIEFRVEPTDEGFLCREGLSKDEKIVKSKEEFLEWSEKIPDNWCMVDRFVELEDIYRWIDSEERTKIEEKLREYYYKLKEKVKEEAEKAWEWMEIEYELD